MELKQSKDVCIDKLTSTEGKDLEIMANITSPAQLNAVLLGYTAQALNSRYGYGECQLLLRSTCSWKGRARDDLTGIGKVPEVQAWQRGDDTL